MGLTTDPFHAALLAELPMLRRLCRNLARHQTDADDLVQDTLLLALRYRDSFTPDSNMGAWLSTIARNAKVNETRRARNRRTHIDASDMVVEGATKLTVQPAAEHRLMLRDCLRAIAAAPADIRAAYINVRLRGEPHDAYAARIGVSSGTSKSRVHRMDKRLAKVAEV